jgi:alanine-glyoxylate transaminase / serine-glyoxylate transaminase / serine-pyruvate transaminase
MLSSPSYANTLNSFPVKWGLFQIAVRRGVYLVTQRTNLLMIPGPVEVHEEVLELLGRPVVPHYGPEWVEVHTDVLQQLQQVFKTEGDIFLIPGSGSAGIDAAVGSLLAPEEKCLIGVNGFFSERLAAIARSRGAQVIEVTAEWGQPISVEAVLAVLRSIEGIKALCVVHHETSTGVLNPVHALGEIARRHGIIYIVDAISSLGGERLRMDDWCIDVCVAASQKCLEAPPGLSPVAVGPMAWQAMDQMKNLFCGWYLNLRTWREYARLWADWHPFPVTLPTNLILALQGSLNKLMKETLEGRIQRYASNAARLRHGLHARGFELLVPDAVASSSVTSAKPPTGLSADDLITHLRVEQHIHVAGGMGKLKGEIIRIGHMGQAATPQAIDRLLAALDDISS